MNYIDGSPCLSSNCIDTCISQVNNIAIENVTLTSAQVIWNDNNASNTEWQVGISTFPFNTPAWVDVNSNTYTFAGLNPDTLYSICVRPLCPFGFDSTNTCAFFTTSGNTDFCAGTLFTDSGGTENNYTDMENWTRIVAPVNPDDKIKVVFNAFETETDYDFLYVYDGVGTSGTLLTPNGLNGLNTIPGHLHRLMLQVRLPSGLHQILIRISLDGLLISVVKTLVFRAMKW
ncbi:hypothetical protein [Flavobacterium sp. 3HN19-14]|uniref:hypothetical protein n=1 Tax=Flavobacterium sp. 3HN19-14 TaxID=3448133 RepID=UPI003EDE9E6C